MADDQTRMMLAQMLLGQQAPQQPVPFPPPDPRGPPVAVGQPPDQSGSNVPPQAYGISDHALAALRAVFEGEKYRDQMAPFREGPGSLYNRRR